MHEYVEVAAEWYRGSGSTLEENFHVSDYQRGEGGACSSTAAEGGWGEHCTGLCKMVMDTAGKGMREGRNWCLGVGG